VCSYGVFDGAIDKCRLSATAVCSSPYAFNQATDKCELSASSVCASGSTYSTSIDKCVIAAIHDCISGTAYSQMSRLCEAIPACSVGTYDATKDKCYEGNNVCPIGNSFPCISEDGVNKCSPNVCIDLAVPSNIQLETIDDTMLTNDGARDDAGNCLGEVYLFTGRGMRCRTSGISTGWQNCCIRGEGALKDSIGSLMDMGSAVSTIQNVYHLGQVAYYSNMAIANAWTAAETMAALKAAGHTATVVEAAGAAAGAGSVGVGMNTFIAATINPYTIAASVAIKLAVDTFLSGSCDQQDLETGMLESSGRCHYVGEWCEKKWPLVGCVQKAEGYCCFNSKLARIIHEKGRPQLKAFQPAGAWGTEKPAGPNCRGFTSAEFQMLDFSKIDLSEYFGEITAKAQSSIITGTQNKISDFYNKIQGR